MLARPAEGITVGDVARAREGSALDVPFRSGSVVTEVWGGAAGALEAALDLVTLADLAARQAEIDSDRAPVYCI